MKLSKKTIFAVIICMLLILTIYFFGNYFSRHVKTKKVRCLECMYTYYDRKITIKDFEDFNNDTTYEEIQEILGPPNGLVGSGMLQPYYELTDGRFAICYSFRNNTVDMIAVADKKEIEYLILLPRLPEKSEEQKDAEVSYAKQYEMNAVLRALGLREWKQKSQAEPLGMYSEEEIKKYTDRNIRVDIGYYYGRIWIESVLALFQVIQIYESDKQVYFGCEVWYGDHTAVECAYMMNEERQQEVRLNVSEEDAFANHVDLSKDSLGSAIGTYLFGQEEMKEAAQWWTWLWGMDENGDYMCIFVTNPEKNSKSNRMDNPAATYYYISPDFDGKYADTHYYVTAEIADGEIETIRYKLLSGRYSVE